MPSPLPLLPLPQIRNCTFPTHKNAVNRLGLLLIWSAALIGLYLLRNQTDQLALSGWENLIALGIIGLWRWSWMMLHTLRSCFYRVWVFPRWRRKANRIPLEQLPPAAIVIPTYKEKPWITERVFRAIAQEAKTLYHPLTLVAVATPEENIAIAEIIKSEDTQFESVNFIPLQDPNQGKRGALAVGLEKLSQLDLPLDTVVALMDGDSELGPGSLRLSLPFFRLFPNMGGLTTNEMPEVYGSYLFSEWLHLRFCQRHQYMCSYALSHKVLCLTGRCSFFRAEAALHPSFRDLLVNDCIHDWLWGQFRFFSGDDKSTWYWLVNQGYEMLYLPDVMVTTIETLSGSIWQRSYQNMRRWSGNMFRNGSRVLALGFRRVGGFTWLCILDQRIAIWTSLISPGILLIALMERNWLGAAIIGCWFLVTRPLYLFIVFWGRPSHLKLLHLPILIVSQWGTSGIKIWTQMNLAQQKWTNRHGNEGRSARGLNWKLSLKTMASRFLLFSQTFAFVVFLLWQYGTLNVNQDLAGWWWTRQTQAQPSPTQIIEAIDHGVYPSDRQDDSRALQTLIDSLPPKGTIQINLPLGEIDLFHPITLHRNHTFLSGKGVQGTLLQVHHQPLRNKAILTISPPQTSNTSDTITNIQLEKFTIELAESSQFRVFTSIRLDHVVGATLKHLNLSAGGKQTLVLSQSRDLTVEYVDLGV